MYEAARRARERIVTFEVRRLEQRQALERRRIDASLRGARGSIVRPDTVLRST